MFYLSCKHTSNSPLEKCINSILEHHLDEKILIVDSESEDKSYYQNYKDYKNIIILDNVNKNRQVGSFEIAYDYFPNEPYYVMIHDTLFFKKSIKKFLDSPEEFFSFMYFPESFNNQVFEFCNQIFSETPYKTPSVGTQIFGTFGPLFIIKNSLMKKMKESMLLSKFKSNSKLEDQHFERIVGIWSEQEGYSPEKYNIEGNCLSRWNEIVDDNLEYFTKIFLTRQ